MPSTSTSTSLPSRQYADAGGGAGEQYVAGQQGEDFGGCGNLFGYGVVHFGGVAFLHDAPSTQVVMFSESVSRSGFDPGAERGGAVEGP